MSKPTHPRMMKVMHKYSVFYLLTIISLLACQADNKSKTKDNVKDSHKKLSSSDIIEKAIQFSGKNKFKDHRVIFEFRDKTYISEGINGRFKLSRIDSSKNTKDVFYKDKLTRKINGKPIKIADSTAAAIKSSINSVHYFVHLPYRLKDPAVKAKRLKNDTIFDTAYYQLKVTFKENGGGEDHQDVYRYWFDQEDFSMDYLAYKFHTNDGGMRFRAKKNEKPLQKIIFQDYNNYKPLSDSLQLDDLSTAYQKNRLEKISEIITMPLEVKPINQTKN